MSRNNRGLNSFLIFGLLALILTVTYRVAFYANYLGLESDEVVFDWTGGEQDVWIYTDANSWVIEDEEYISWATFQNRGGKLHIYAYQNNSKEDRSSWVRIRSGFVEGIGNEYYSLKVVQSGTVATSPPRSGNGVPYVVINATELRLRYGPSLNADTFKWPDGTNRHPNKGEMFKYLGESGDFYKIDYKGSELWVSHINNYSYIMYR